MPASDTSMAGSDALFVHAELAVPWGHVDPNVPGGGLGLGGVPPSSKFVKLDRAAAASPALHSTVDVAKRSMASAGAAVRRARPIAAPPRIDERSARVAYRYPLGAVRCVVLTELRKLPA